MNVTWLESPYRNLRDPRYPIRGVVNHRIVGTLPSARAAFGVASGTPRRASTHFGIGYVGGKLTIDQYVDLSDMAWGNGDVREPSWSLIQAGVNPNLTTVSIEHEDGGSANRGRVSDEVWAASMSLQRLITIGDAKAIRAAGVHLRHDHTAAQLAAIPKDERGFIDHHQIAGPNKPYCFRRWLDDPGFVEGNPSRRDRLLAHLNGDPMSWIDDIMPIAPLAVKYRAGASYRLAPDLDTGGVAVLSYDSPRTVIGTVKGFDFGAGPDWDVILSANGGIKTVHSQDRIGSGVELVAPTGGVTKEQLAQAKRLEFGRGRDEGIAAYTGAGVTAAKAVTP